MNLRLALLEAFPSPGISSDLLLNIWQKYECYWFLVYFSALALPGTAARVKGRVRPDAR